MTVEEAEKLGVEFTLEIEEEDTPVRGNAMASGDDAADKALEDSIIDRLSVGDLWAWCCVRVTASITIGGTRYSGDDYLGGCSYDGERDFKQSGGYYEDMKENALWTLISIINDSEINFNIKQYRKELKALESSLPSHLDGTEETIAYAGE